MAQTYWDPANLLQITDDDDSRGDIQCVGRARSAFDARCRWTVQEHERATARSLLTQLAARKPDAVTADELRRLAQCCLCQYHGRQQGDAVSRWTRVARRAVEQHDRLIATARSEQRLPTPEAEDVVSVKLELERALATAGARSAERVGALEADLREARDRLLSTEKGYVQLRALLGMAQQENGDLSRRATEAERQRDALKEQLEKAVGEAAANRDAESTQQSITRLETAVRDLEDERASLHEQLVAANDNAMSRQEEVDRLSKAVEGLEHDNASLQHELKAAKNELEHRQTVADRLSKAATDLQHDKLSLQEQLKAAFLRSEDKQNAVDRVSADVDSLRAEDGKLRIERQAVADKFDTQQTALDSLSNDIDSLRLENGKLRADRDAALNNLKSTTLERNAARDDASRLAAGLEESRTELEVERGRSAELHERTAALGRTVSTLEASVVACSLHGFGVWFGRQSRKLARRSRPRTVEDGGGAVPV
ncbi:hypothetical protein DL764_005051 [Monosporascus ibericus]|uniref:Uncharacterized protein n=1 Tax=Monosporascus ibericus TaxID=155417 RepID=A0A4Q4TDP1_9PEZI|nr:hypothetical protein DL764_005051 [Monosporascus ibericus]